MDGMFPYGAIVALGVFVYESVWACVCVVRIGVGCGCTLSGCVCCIPGKFVIGFFFFFIGCAFYRCVIYLFIYFRFSSFRVVLFSYFTSECNGPLKVGL